jgi:hypothetical protein
MPYISDPDEATVTRVRNALLAVALRHADSGLDAFVRIPRFKLHQLAAPDVRKEDFYEAVRRLAEESDAVREATGTGRRADVLLDRIVDEVGEWEEFLYEDFPEDTPEPEELAAWLAGFGLDTSSPIPTDLLVKRTVRPPIVHDPDVPRRCAKCEETKPTTEFGRRSADRDHPGYLQFQSYCKGCTRKGKRQWAADNGDRRTSRPERYGTGRTGRIRPGGRHPNNPTHRYQFTN